MPSLAHLAFGIWNFFKMMIKSIFEVKQSATQSDSFAKLTDNEKKMVDEFVEFLRQE